jgi:hypothetical protein
MEMARLQRGLLIFWVHYSNVNSKNTIVKIAFESNNPTFPELSIILLDWSCRETFHSLHYLNNQTVPRKHYEIIWIEYYSRCAPEIETGFKECNEKGKHPILDKWIVMGMPENVYFHKHLMYNIGIISSQGEIITFCDSDAMFRPTFVESIIEEFKKDRNIVLHIDELRNIDRRYYPFNFPSLKEVLSTECINWKDGKTTGLLDKEDPIHSLNYGSCMCALREDLINIGGADEHIDYLGHICGPYDMTFRLVNAGKKEVWHEEEFLYHTWHPGTDGKGNYLGPHDGMNMSTTALFVKRTGRVMPLVENPAIELLRLGQDNILYEPLLSQAIPERDLQGWTIRELNKKSKSMYRYFIKHPSANFKLMLTFLKILIKHLNMKVTKFSRQPKSSKDLIKKVFKVYSFLKNTIYYYKLTLEKCDKCLKELTSNKITEFAVYGTGDTAEVLYKKTLFSPVKISAVYGPKAGGNFFGHKVMPVETMTEYNGIIIVADSVGEEDKTDILKELDLGDRIRLL